MAIPPACPARRCQGGGRSR